MIERKAIAHTTTWQAQITRSLLRRTAWFADKLVGDLARKHLRSGNGFQVASTPLGTYIELPKRGRTRFSSVDKLSTKAN